MAGGSQTYVGIEGEAIIGYLSLVVGEVKHAEAPPRLAKGIAKHPVPIMLLARLAVDSRWKRLGVGKALLRDTMLRTLQAADIPGIRALAVHAKDEEARSFYQHLISSLLLPTPCTYSSC